MSKKRFVVLLASETDEQVRAFKAYIEEHHLGFWHWLSGSWLLTDPSNIQTAEGLRDALNTTHPRINKLVLEILGDDFWSGYGPGGEERNMFTWLKTTWKGN